MCTAFSLNNNNHYFGRSLDLEFHYNEQVIIIPKKYKLNYRYTKINDNHLSFFGIGIIANNYPLLYDGCNESGLCIAGLNMPASTNYNIYKTYKTNLCSFELIPYLLSKCNNCEDVMNMIDTINITNDSFNNDFPVSKLHFIISDKNQSLTLEIINGKINLYKNIYNVLTNEPELKYHEYNINKYSHFDNLVKNHIKGSNLIGIPGDNTSTSRFIKMNFNIKYIKFESVSELFNIYNNVFELNGTNKTLDNKFYKTIYMVIYNSTNKILYFKTYNNSQIYSCKLYNYQNDNKLFYYSIYNDENIIDIKKVDIKN